MPEICDSVEAISIHTHTSVPLFCLMQPCTPADPWGNSGTSWGSQWCWEGRNAVIHRTTILCLHSRRGCTVNAKQGQVQIPGLQWKLWFSSVCMDKKSRLCWSYYLIIHCFVWLAASNNLAEASVHITWRISRCNIPSALIFIVFTSGKKGRENALYSLVHAL